MAPLTEQLQQAIADHKDELWKLNQEIWSHPELGYKEYQAHDNISNYLEGLGYTVRRHAYGLETSFEAELQVGEGGGLLVYNAEYDSLPGIGHACGHNLIATSSIAAFVLTAEAMKANGITGTVRLLGTPAEETEGGKIKLIEAGAFKGVDACLMGHPVPKVAPVHGVISPGMNACTHATVTFHGLNAHAGNAPWLGKNALDAAVQAYTSMSMLRQQIEPSQRIHAIITKGGDKPNIIPHLTEMEVVARAQKTEPMEETVKRLNACFEGAAAAAGCTVDIEWKNPYKDLNSNSPLASKFAECAKEAGQKYLEHLPDGPTGASTDQGNVSYEVPSLHPVFLIPVKDLTHGNHHPGFTEAVGTEEAFELALGFARTLAATGYAVLEDKELRERAHKEFP